MFGMSRLYEKDDDMSCAEECDHIDDPEPVCPLTEQPKAKDHCSILSDKTGKFKVWLRLT